MIAYKQADTALHRKLGVMNLKAADSGNFSDAYDYSQKTSEEDVSTNEMTREEMTVRLELVEAKSDARLSRFEERIDQAISEMQRDRAALKDDVRILSSEFKSSKIQIIIAIFGTGLAIVSGIVAFNATMLSNMVASFESGKNAATAITQAVEQLKQTQQQLQVAQEKLTPKK